MSRGFSRNAVQTCSDPFCSPAPRRRVVGGVAFAPNRGSTANPVTGHPLAFNPLTVRDRLFRRSTYRLTNLAPLVIMINASPGRRFA